MAERDFFDETAKQKVAAAVAAIEARTRVEVVVAVRHRAARDHGPDWIGGALLALAVLAAVLFLPHPFTIATIPLDVVLAFVLGAVGTAYSPTLRRWLTSAKARAADVRTAARAAFVDLGVSRTRARTGLLVYVALGELAVEVVADIGLDGIDNDRDWRAAVTYLRECLRAGPALPRLLTALDALGPPLAALYPRADDDANELPDAPQ